MVDSTAEEKPVVEELDPIQQQLAEENARLEQRNREEQEAKEKLAAITAQKRVEREESAKRRAEKKLEREATKAQKAQEKEAKVAVTANKAVLNSWDAQLEGIELEPAEKASKLAEAETAIETFEQGSIVASLAFYDVQRYKLYEVSGYASLQDYGALRWGVERAMAFRLAQSGKVYRRMQLMFPGDTVQLPANERQLKEFFPLNKKKLIADPNAIKDVWQGIVDTAGDTTITAKTIENAVTDYLSLRKDSADTSEEVEAISGELEKRATRMQRGSATPTGLKNAIQSFVQADMVTTQYVEGEARQAIDLVESGNSAEVLTDVDNARGDDLSECIIVSLLSPNEKSTQDFIRTTGALVCFTYPIMMIDESRGIDKFLPKGAMILYIGTHSSETFAQAFSRWGMCMVSINRISREELEAEYSSEELEEEPSEV